MCVIVNSEKCKVHLEVTELQGIGEILKKTREEQGVSLEEVAEATKIRTKYLSALEEEQFDVLPGDVYAKGFATAYLKYLGIKDRPDVVKVMTAKVEAPKEAEQQETEKAVKKEVVRKASEPVKQKKTMERFEEIPLNKNAKLIILLSVAAIFLLFMIQGAYSNQVPDDLLDSQIQEQQEQPKEDANAEKEPVVPEEPEVPVYDGLEMRLEIVDANPNKKDQCWMKITVDGNATETTLAEGMVQDIKATQAIQLNLGNAGVVKVTLNGQDLGLMGNQGQVVKKEFKLEDYVTTAQ